MDISSESAYNGGMMPSDADLARIFRDMTGRPLERQVELREFSNFRIGGPADYFFTAETGEELIAAVRFARAHALPFYMIGGGTNLLFDDAGFRGLILRSGDRSLAAGAEGRIEAASGARLSDLTALCLSEEIGGLEFLAGIPGTIGGAVYGNAGAFGRAVGEVLLQARILNESGQPKTIDPGDFEFSYRWSRLKQTREVLLSATLRGDAGSRVEIEARVNEILAQRAGKHPCRGTACAGSWFKNPVLPSGEKVPAARLLDQVGAKSRRVGGAAVYSGHANFIINTGDATSRDVLKLGERLKLAVEKRFKIRLEEEVIYLPAKPPAP